MKSGVSVRLLAGSSGLWLRIVAEQESGQQCDGGDSVHVGIPGFILN